MRAGLEVFARRWWAGELGGAGRVLSVLALPLSWAWAGASLVAGVRLAVASSQRVEGLTVISVGNLAVGGTGKTPVVAWIAGQLRDSGVAAAILVGGQGRDEALLHSKRLPGTRVIVDRDRVAGALQALAAGASGVVLDDGFQHRSLRRDMDIVLLAAEDAFPGQLLPRGPYRERPGALARADVILVTRRSAFIEEGQRLVERVEKGGWGEVAGALELAAAGWTHLDGRRADPPQGDALAVCAIARAAEFRSTVARTLRGSVELVAFADHHEYTPADIVRLEKRASDRAIVVTEKDAVKLSAYAGTLGDTYVLTEAVRWDWGEEAFVARLQP